MISIDDWKKRGERITTHDGAIFGLSHGHSQGEDVLVLHGFPGSSWDCASVIERISEKRRVVSFDFLGYGLSDKPERYGYSLFEQADGAIAVARHFGLRHVHLLAHDVGTSVATELLARRERGLLPFEIASLVLTNGSVHVELTQLTVGQKLLRSPLGPIFARLNNRRSFVAQLRRTFGRQPSEAELNAMWELVSRDDGAKRLPALIRYVEERKRHFRRWIGALERLDIPTLIAWGERDPVAIMAIAHALHGEIPGARLETFPELGHWPMMEDPEAFSDTLERFWPCEGVSSSG